MSQTTDTTDTDTDDQTESTQQQLDRVDENVAGLFAKVSSLEDRINELEAANAVLRQQLADGGEDS
jgi:phage shock protein A